MTAFFSVQKAQTFFLGARLTFLLLSSASAGLTAAGIDFEINGSVAPDNLNHVLNLWLKGVSTYIMQTNLDLAGIAVSGGSACTAGSLEPSHVLTAMYGADSPRISESIRVSFGALNTAAEIDQFVATVVKIIRRIKG